MSRRPVEIRPWRRADDLPPLMDVSKAADELCTDFGLNLPVDDSPDEPVNAEHVLVAGTPPVGFAAVDTVDGNAHRHRTARIRARCAGCAPEDCGDGMPIPRSRS